MTILHYSYENYETLHIYVYTTYKIYALDKTVCLSLYLFNFIRSWPLRANTTRRNLRWKNNFQTKPPTTENIKINDNRKKKEMKTNRHTVDLVASIHLCAHHDIY